MQDTHAPFTNTIPKVSLQDKQPLILQRTQKLVSVWQLLQEEELEL